MARGRGGPMTADGLNDIAAFVVVCDANDVIKYVNRAFADAFGAAPDRWRGQKFAPVDRERARADANGQRSFRTAATSVDGPCVINWTIEPIEGAGRAYVGRRAVDRRGQPPHASYNPDLDALAMEERFVAIMSHEMRTPLNGVLGMTKLLAATELTANQRTYVDAIRDSGSALLALINDVLDYSKLNAEKFELASEPFDLPALVQSVAELLAPRAAEKQIELATYVDPALPSRLVGDEARIRQVLLNLVGNGVKFTDEGGVLIEARAEAVVGDEIELAIDVRDTGGGIEPAEQRAIFREFAQVGAQVGAPESTGLRLAISQRLAAAMGGGVDLESAPGEGSVFTFTCKLAAASAAPASQAKGAVAPATVEPGASDPLRGAHVVAACRNPALARALRLNLEAAGVARVVLVRDARRAEAAAAEFPEALFLCDDAVRDVPPPSAARRAFVLLAEASRPAFDDFRAQGCGGFLVMPSRFATLARELAEKRSDGAAFEAVAARRAQPAAKAGAPQDDAKTAPPAAAKRVLLVEDNKINALLATALLKRAGCVVDVAVEGAEAVALAGEGRHDIIFMDMHMPGMNGLEAAQRIRALKGAAAEAPIVALTANAMASDRKKCLDAGMNDFLSKPFEPEDLQHMLDKWAGGAGPGAAKRSA
ncbi:MAG: response regulator [Parvularculaceae bacterium]